MSEPLSPHPNICKVEIELPWEIAKLVAIHGPAFIAAITQAVGVRIEDQKAEDEKSLRITEECNRVQRERAALARECIAELNRRANGPGQRRTIIKQLAVEYGIDASSLTMIIDVFGRQFRQEERRKQDAEFVRLHLTGLTHDEIAAQCGVSRNKVQKHLAKQADVIARLQTEASDTPNSEDK